MGLPELYLQNVTPEKSVLVTNGTTCFRDEQILWRPYATCRDGDELPTVRAFAALLLRL